MSFSGGTYTLPAGNPVVTATTITSTWANTTMSDIATALSTCLLKDGTQTVTANIPMASFKFTGLAAGSAAGNSLRYEQLFNASGITLIGDLLFTDGLFDIGKSGATRPRDLFMSRNLTVGGTAAITGHVTVEGVTSTGATGTGKLVFDGTPTLTTAVLGSSTATTQTAADNSTKVATTAYIDRGAASSEILIGTLQTASASATIDFAAASYAAAFDGSLAEVTFHWEGVRPGTDAVVLNGIMGTGAGPTYHNSVNDYEDAGNTSSSGAANTAFGNALRAYISLTGEINVGNAATRQCCGSARLAASAANTTFLPGIQYDATCISSAGVMNRITGAGRYNSAGAITGFRFQFGSGNIAEGIFWVTGKRKS